LNPHDFPLEDLTARDVFALFALCGLLARGPADRDVDNDEATADAYDLADAMLGERAGSAPPTAEGGEEGGDR
jgi:hypothetical protein